MVEIKNSINDIIISSAKFLAPFTKAQEEYNTFIRIKTKLSKSLDKKTIHPKKASLIRKYIIDNIILNSIWAISGVKNYKDFLEDVKKKKTGTITITTKKSKEKAVIEIKDNGCGIKKQDLNKIFKKDYSTKKTSGLGLFMADKVIKKLKGDIRVESEPKKFTKMTITI